MSRSTSRNTTARASSCSLAALDSQVDLHPFIVLLQDAVVFAQGIPLPSLGQQNALHVGMPVKLDAKHIEDLALQPVRRRPDGHGTGNALAVKDLRLHPNALVTRI